MPGQQHRLRSGVSDSGIATIGVRPNPSERGRGRVYVPEAIEVEHRPGPRRPGPDRQPCFGFDQMNLFDPLDLFDLEFENHILPISEKSDDLDWHFTRVKFIDLRNKISIYQFGTRTLYKI